MTITTWNCCQGKKVDSCLKRLKGLKADLVTLQECKRPSGDGAKIIWKKTDPNQCVDEVSTQKSLQTGTGEQIIWQGRKANTYGGVAVVCTRSWQIEFVKIPFLHRNVVPVVVHSPEPFMFVGVWTQREPSYAKVAWEVMTACHYEANKRGLPLVAAGDFNIWPALKNKKAASDSLKFLNCVQTKLKLVSAYHKRSGEAKGKETYYTYYHKYRGKYYKFHIDYCFVPEYWRKPVCVKVGSFKDWIEKKDKRLRSDHCPLTVEIEDGVFGKKPQGN